MECPHELCYFGTETVALPYAITSDPDVLSEMLTLETWNRLLSPEERRRLMTLLPTFDDRVEVRRTLEMLFTGESLNFGNPVDAVVDSIRSGRNQPEVLELYRRSARRKRREARYRLRSYYHNLLKQCVESRHRLLEANLANNAAWTSRGNGGSSLKSGVKRRAIATVTNDPDAKRAEALMKRAETRLAKEMKQIELESMFSTGKKSGFQLEATSSESSSSGSESASDSSLSSSSSSGSSSDSESEASNSSSSGLSNDSSSSSSSLSSPSSSVFDDLDGVRAVLADVEQ